MIECDKYDSIRPNAQEIVMALSIGMSIRQSSCLIRLMRVLTASALAMVMSHPAMAQSCAVNEIRKVDSPSFCSGNGITGSWALSVAASGDTALVGSLYDGPGTACQTKG